jgi:hypothetical protein
MTSSSPPYQLHWRIGVGTVRKPALIRGLKYVQEILTNGESFWEGQEAVKKLRERLKDILSRTLTVEKKVRGSSQFGFSRGEKKAEAPVAAAAGGGDTILTVSEGHQQNYQSLPAQDGLVQGATI